LFFFSAINSVSHAHAYKSNAFSPLPLTCAAALPHLPLRSRRPHLHPPECCRYPLHLQVGSDVTNSDLFFHGSGSTSPLHPAARLTNLPRRLSLLYSSFLNDTLVLYFIVHSVNIQIFLLFQL
jgi:hypothetical protein